MSSLEEVKARIQKKRMELLLKQQKQNRQPVETIGTDYGAEEEEEEEEEHPKEDKKKKETRDAKNDNDSDDDSDSDNDDPYDKLGLPSSFK